MSILVLDVETVPLAASLAEPYPDADRLPPGNYSKPDSIAAWREKDKIAWREQRVKECSLTPRLGRICCFGSATDDSEPTTFLAGTEQQERALLEHAWDLVGPFPTLVTFNGTFDLRFLVIRSAILGVKVPVNPSTLFQRYRTAPHFDCRAVLTGWDDRQSGKLSEWCAAFGIPSTDTTSGADIYDFAQAGNWDAIATHCRADVEQTRQLYRRIATLFSA